MSESSKRYITVSELQDFFRLNKAKWLLARVTTFIDFTDFLLSKEILLKSVITLPGGRQTERFSTVELSDYELALSINKDSYLSHYTALYLHDLTDNIPKTIYTNREQTRKTVSRAELVQDRIDFSFSRPMRKSNQIAEFNLARVYLLNGKNVDRLGVTTIQLDALTLPITSIERTLIDSCVRPDYAGGVHEVLKAFKAAKGKISVNKIVAMLKQMDYIYPYHQALGLYLEKAGYEERLLRLVDKIDKQYDFYLTYAMRDCSYSERWRLFFPNRL
jgi:predicted transcriptional regulator of viral defense system